MYVIAEYHVRKLSRILALGGRFGVHLHSL